MKLNNDVELGKAPECKQQRQHTNCSRWRLYVTLAQEVDLHVGAVLLCLLTSTPLFHIRVHNPGFIIRVHNLTLHCWD